MSFGYVLMSAKPPNANHIALLIEQGTRQQNTFVDCFADKTPNRNTFEQLVCQPGQNDCSVVCSLNQTRINLSEISKAWRTIVVAFRAAIKVLNMPSLLGKPDKELDAEFENIFPDLPAYLSEAESHYLKQRQAAGVARRQATEKKFGQRAKEKPRTFEYWLDQWRLGNVSCREAANQLSISHFTFLRWTKATDQSTHKSKHSEGIA